MAHPFSAAGKPLPAPIRTELDRILASELFLRSDRLSAFLRFVVEETLKADGAALKEHVIAMELYGKGADFSAAADPIVRVDARRLRDKLREFYAVAPPGEVVISMPKGSYTPQFEPGHGSPAAGSSVPLSSRGRAVGDEPATAARPRAGRRLRMTVVAAALVGALAWIVASFGGGTASEAPSRLLTVTSFPGAEEDPSLSPDGNFVAFSWRGPEPGADDDLWVKPVEGDSLRRLTATQDALEKWPSWSPDGRYIAFTRLTLAKETPRIFIVSALGGAERMIADGTMPTWTPDGRALVMVSKSSEQIDAVVYHLLDTGARRQLTSAPRDFTETHPRVSPDGKTVAFHRHGAGRSAILTVPVDGGETRLVGGWTSGLIGGLAWTPDGGEIVFGRPETSGRQLARTQRDGRGVSPVAGVPFGSIGPSASRMSDGAYRLAFVASQADLGLRLIDLGTPPASSMASSPFADATRTDAPGRFSADGTEVAFVSDRDGAPQVWIAKRDGSALRCVTRLGQATVNIGSWSPDGRSVVFEATLAGNTDLFVVRTDGGELKQLTDGPAVEIDPEWSHDGHWIYFSANDRDASTIWKMPARGGQRVQLTTEAGFEPRESPDGRTVYFVDSPRRYNRHRSTIATLKQVSSDGGPVSEVMTGLSPGAWDLTDAGIVFVPGRGSTSEPDTVAIYDFAERRVRSLGALDFLIADYATPRYLTVSRDGQWAIAVHIDRWDRDIMVVDNFR